MSREELTGHPIFAGLTTAEMEELAHALTKVRARPGEKLIVEGEARVDKQGLFVLVSGEADVLKSRQVLATVGAPSLFGEIELLTRMAPTATVRAREDLELYWLGRDELDRLLRAGRLAAHKVLGNVARLLAQRLRATNEKLVSLLPADKQKEFSEFRAKILSDWNF